MPRSRWAAVARVSIVLVLLQAATLAWLVHAGRARAHQALEGFGKGIMRYAEAERHDSPRTLYLNGTALHFSVGSVRKPVSEVLDQVESGCLAQGIRLQDAIAVSPPSTVGSDAWRDIPFIDGTLREDGRHHGWVACLDVGDEPLQPKQLWQRLQRFAETGDLSRVGRLRYVRAERASGRAHTTYVTFVHDGPLNVRRMFPATGDAPGVDPVSLARPSGARRILSAWEVGKQPAINVYTTSTQGPDRLLAHYREALRGDTWALRPQRPESGSPFASTRGFIAERHGRQLLITAGSFEHGAFVVVAKLH